MLSHATIVAALYPFLNPSSPNTSDVNITLKQNNQSTLPYCDSYLSLPPFAPLRPLLASSRSSLQFSISTISVPATGMSTLQIFYSHCCSSRRARAVPLLILLPPKRRLSYHHCFPGCFVILSWDVTRLSPLFVREVHSIYPTRLKRQYRTRGKPTR